MFQRPPGAVFHLAMVPAALWLVYAHSFPGYEFFGAAMASAFLLAAAVVWALRVATFVWATHKAAAHGPWRWLLTAPLGGLAIVAIVSSGLPLQTRWRLAADDFERAARAAPPPTDVDEWVSFDVPARIGSYRVLQAVRVGNGVIFYDAEGALFDDAGFAFLPSGPFAELNTGWFESPRFQPLGEGWYTWTASW